MGVKYASRMYPLQRLEEHLQQLEEEAAAEHEAEEDYFAQLA
jgi:hypothetical protein